MGSMLFRCLIPRMREALSREDAEPMLSTVTKSSSSAKALSSLAALVSWLDDSSLEVV
jgi:hypothetical protein